MFTVRLPIAAVGHAVGDGRDTRRPKPSHQETHRNFDAPPELRGLRVVTVDDEPDGREIVAGIVAPCEVVVTTAASVAEAMAVVERESPDVVLTDIGMPGEDGYILIARLRALPKNLGGATPAACLAGYAGGDDRRRALLAGFTTHLPKPVDPAELVAVVTSLARMATALKARTG
ncbi:MAG: response regulator [Polyangiaceae bacterium]